MGRLNVGGGGKQVEIKHAGYAYADKTSAMAQNIIDMHGVRPRYTIGVNNGIYYFYESAHISAYSINADNTLTLINKVTKYNVQDPRPEGFEVLGVCIAPDYLVAVVNVASAGMSARWYKFDLETLETVAFGKYFGYKDSTGRIFPRGKLYFADGEYFFLYLDNYSKGLLKDSNGSDIASPTNVTTRLGHGGISTTANQTCRLGGNLIGALQQGTNMRVMDRFGNIKGYVEVDDVYFVYSDGNNVYSWSGKVYEPCYVFKQNTNSIPNPKRKNLTAKFDVLPEMLK